MKTNAKEAELLRKAIDRWEAEGRVDAEQAEQLRRSIEVVPVNWRKITQVAFVVALGSAVLSLVYLLADDFLLELFYRLMNAPYPLLAGLFSLAAAGGYFLAWRRQRRRPGRPYSNEVLMLAAGALAGCAIYFIGCSIDPDLPYVAPLFLAGGLLGLTLGWGLPSPATWVAGWLALSVWFGLETQYRAGADHYWWGMNLPLRYLPFGLLLVGGSALLRRGKAEPFFTRSLRLSGLLLVFLALWALSLFGNYASWSSWEGAGEWSFVGYSLLLLAAALGAAYLGRRRGDHQLRGLGMLFLLVALYTKFIEHAWPRLHGALFFLLLALSFWWIGRRAEQLWELSDP